MEDEKQYTGESRVSFEGAVDDALHREENGLTARGGHIKLRVVSWEIEADAHSPWHITTWRVTLQDT